MPTLHRTDRWSVRVNAPDHRPAHVHIVLPDRRDALVYLDTLEMFSRTIRVSEIREPLAWIAAHRDYARKIFEECSP